MGVTTLPDDVHVDESRQRGTEHNAKAFAKTLHEAGFPQVVMRPLSEFTIALHTRTLTDQERKEFTAWVASEPAVKHARDDKVGAVYFVNI